MDIKFNSVEELYQRIKPALSTKRAEMKRNGITYATEEDIWNYLKENKWKTSKDLSLYEMTCDIFNVDDVLIDSYLRNKMNKRTRKIYFE